MKKTISGLLLTLFATSTFATSYIGIEGGSARTKDFYNGMQEASNEIGGNGGFASTGASFGRIYAGKYVTDAVSTELGYFTTGDFTGQIYRQNASTINAKADASGFDASLIAKHPSGVYAKAGVYHASVKGQVWDQARSVSFKDSDEGVLIGVGYEHAFTKNVSGHVGATHYNKLFNTFTLGIKSTF